MKNCLLCGEPHDCRMTPCDRSKFDPIWGGRYQMPPKLQEIEEKAQEEYSIQQIKRKRGRPHGKDREK